MLQALEHGRVDVGERLLDERTEVAVRLNVPGAYQGRRALEDGPFVRVRADSGERGELFERGLECADGVSPSMRQAQEWPAWARLWFRSAGWR